MGDRIPLSVVLRRLLAVMLLVCWALPECSAAKTANELLQLVQDIGDKYEKTGDLNLRDKELAYTHEFLKIYKTNDWTRYAMLRNFELGLYKAEKYSQSIIIAKQLLKNKFCVGELEKDLATEADNICYVKTLNRMFGAIHKTKRAEEPATQELFEQFVTKHRFKGEKKIFWVSLYQFPLFAAPNLQAKAWWPSDMPGAVALTKGYAKIKEEGLRLLKRGLIQGREMDSGLAKTGEWQDFLLGDGEYNFMDPAACKQTPDTCGIIMNDPYLKRGMLLGQVAFLVLVPGTRLDVHAGRRNDRINLHLGIQVPEGNAEELGIRAGDEREEGATRQWKAGEVIAFDDSFVHEAWNYAKEPRLVLQIFHPHPDGPGFRSEKKLKKLEL